MKTLKRVVFGVGLLLVGYVSLYVIDTGLGGYYPYYASDGTLAFDGVIPLHDCIIWQPRVGEYFNDYRHDFIGSFFYPLIILDHRFVHRTHSVLDKDFAKWWNSVSESQIHPRHRAAWRSWGADGKL